MRTFLLLLAFCGAANLAAQLVGDTETGLASYLSREYDGMKTAYDVTYNRNELVAAHKSFPFNSTVSVRNLDNNKTVNVRIIDKGPFIRGRVVELSERAAEALGMLNQTTAPVEVTLKALAPSNPVRSTTQSATAPAPAASRPKVTVVDPEPAPAPRTAARVTPPSS